MKLRIMVTGKNRKIATDICDHLTAERDYTIIKCPSTKSALFEMAVSEMPHVVIICTGNESNETVKAFDVLKEVTKGGFTSIIIIANDEDRKTFINETSLEKMFFLARPVSLLALYTKLEELEEQYKDEAQRGSSAITEYVNDNPREEFERKHILVVDDDPEQLAMIKEHLREFYEVTLVSKGANVLKVLGKFKVDLILLDYMMPEMDGPEVLLTLKAYPEYRDIPIVFLTGMKEREVVMKTLMELKPQGYILKPPKKSELVAKIIDVVG